MSTNTDGVTNACIFQWQIENISHCWLKEKIPIVSPSFVADVLEGTKWLLLLYPKGHSGSTKDFVDVFLYRSVDCSGPEDIVVKFQFSCQKKDGSLHINKVQNAHKFKKNTFLGQMIFNKRNCLFVTDKEFFFPNDTLTLQCIIWKVKDLAPVVSKRFYSRTVFKVNRRSFQWRIDNFSTLKSGFRNEFEEDLIKFALILNEGLDIEKELLLNISSCQENLKYFSFELSIIDSERKKEECGTHEYFEDDLKKGVTTTVLFIKKVMDNKGRYLPNDVLSLDCEYVCSDGSVLYEYCVCGITVPKLKNEMAEKEIELKKEKEEYTNTTVLVNDLKFMFNDAICSDTVLRTSTQSFPAHKSILSARSPVFRNMFSTDMKEKNSGQVNITDFEDGTVRRMLLYVYTNSLEDLNFESACKLYAAADKYQILTLRNRCSSFIKRNLCPTGACDVLILTELHQDEDLKTAAVDYIVGQGKKFFCSQEWKDFMNSNIKLAADVMCQKIYRE